MLEPALIERKTLFRPANGTRLLVKIYNTGSSFIDWYNVAIGNEIINNAQNIAEGN